ncbi:MAG TPA: MMPL family transporter [Phaeodactylibacter sp.]|nr:MMPL family transporter [Phaeodactylibacter sp.]
MQVLNPFLQLSYRRPRTTLLALFALTLLLAAGLRQLETRNSFDGELPADDPINQGIEAVEAVFGERSVVLIGLEAESAYTPEAAQKIIDISNALTEVPHVLPDEIVSLSTLANVSQRSWGLETGGFLDELPADEAAWQQLQADVAGNAMVLGRLVSADGSLAVIAAALEDGFDGGAVYEAVSEIAAHYAGPERIHITGAPVLVEDVQRGISGDSRRFIPIAIVLIFIGFYISFRRLAGVLLPVGMVIMSIIWTMGFMGYAGLPVTVVSNALPVIMVAVASSYAIHFMNAYYRLAGQYETGPALAEATLQKIGLPILITGLTSALGSASLLIFKITSLREFGIIGSVGFLLATFICLTFLPAVCALLKPPARKAYQSAGLQRFLRALTQMARGHRRAVAAAYLLLIALAVYFIGQVKIGDDYLKFFPKSHQGRIAAETFNDRLSGVRTMDIMVDATPYGGIKDDAFFRSLNDFQDGLMEYDEVGHTYSYRDVVRHLSANLNGETDALPENAEIAQYLMLHEMSATPGEVFALRSEDDNQARIQVFLKSSDPEVHQALYEDIQADAAHFFPEGGTPLTFGGDVMHRIALGTYIVEGKVLNIILALLIVFLSCLIIFRSLSKSLMALLPITVSLLMVFGLMGLIGIRLGISTALLTAMIVGIGVDFAVHYLVGYFRDREEMPADEAIGHNSLHTGQAIAYDAASNIAGFSVLSFSGFLPVQHFGWLLALSMLLIFLNTMVLYPAMLVQKEQRLAPPEFA